MTPEETARASADAVAHLTSHFMLDPATFTRGAGLGFTGIDFYVAGRGGVLGDVDADVVSAAFVLFEPGAIRTFWEMCRGVMSRYDAAVAFAECSDVWARAHVPGDFDCAPLADLAGRVVAAASPMMAPLFAGWRALPLPDDTPAISMRHMNALRELRFAMHACALRVVGLTPVEALTVRSPQMVTMFGWPESGVDPESARSRWEEAEAHTDRIFGEAFAVLSEAEREEFVRHAVDVKVAATGS